jgi:predicted enzyme related to lactoylglutathione lyase
VRRDEEAWRMSDLVKFGAVSIDCADPGPLAAFYRNLLDGEIMFESERFVAVTVPGAMITMQKVADHQPPTWPDDAVAKQIHLEFAVDELDAAEARAVALGAVVAKHQPSPDRWRVLIDPAGHPFCLTTLIPT